MIKNLIKQFNWRNRQEAIARVVSEFCRNENTTCQECGDEFTPDGNLMCESCRD